MVTTALEWKAERARNLLVSKLENGLALAKFEQFISYQGGKPHPNQLIESAIGQSVPVLPADAGSVKSMDPEAPRQVLHENSWRTNNSQWHNRRR